ncbi:MAG: hypothetical protein GQ531_07870 [Sulfurovum sp.]|nr:hypothetical protein [Sulfurovum sp.]
MNMQKISDKWTKEFVEKAEATLDDHSKIPLPGIKKYARMLIIYCDMEGKVSEDFLKSMDVCSKEIIAVEGLEEIFNVLNVCPEADKKD